jgi:hypothetical protein
MKAPLLLGTAGLALCVLVLPVAAQTTSASQTAQAPKAPAFGAQNQKRAARTDVAVDQLPQAVTSAVQTRYPKATIVSATKLALGPEMRYELTIKETPDAAPTVMYATADGTTLRGRGAGPIGRAGGAGRRGGPPPDPNAAKPGESISVNDLPKSVAKAIKDAYPKNTIREAFKITIPDGVQYQVTLDDVSSLKPMKVLIGSDGVILKR